MVAAVDLVVNDTVLMMGKAAAASSKREAGLCEWHNAFVQTFSRVARPCASGVRAGRGGARLKRVELRSHARAGDLCSRLKSPPAREGES